MDSQIVPVQLVFDTDEARVHAGTTAFMESTPTEAGWQIDLVLIGSSRNLQANIRFRGLFPFELGPLPTNMPVELITGDRDDAVFHFSINGQSFEAPFCFGGVEGIISQLFEDDDDEPDFIELEDMFLSQEQDSRVH